MQEVLLGEKGGWYRGRGVAGEGATRDRESRGKAWLMNEDLVWIDWVGNIDTVVLWRSICSVSSLCLKPATSCTDKP